MREPGTGSALSGDMGDVEQPAIKEATRAKKTGRMTIIRYGFANNLPSPTPLSPLIHGLIKRDFYDAL
ncbi:hypothetical protein PSCICO_47410 [Pseudomonas cichorii]|nr:hypothetical protein PSCICO_47410 [Pseudomonas cichorii]